MAVKHWDEESIDALYREYQETRDGIDYRRYQPILEAAREMLDQEQIQVEETELERRLEPILDEARAMYLQQDRSEVIDWSSSKDRIESGGLLSELGSALSAGIMQLFESMSPARWVPVAVTAALVIAVVPVVLQEPDHQNFSGQMVARTQELQQHGEIVSAELSVLIENQYGFSSSDSEYAGAFNAGVLLIDIMSSSQHPDGPVLRSAYEALAENMSGKLDLSDTEAVDWPERATKLGDILQNYYRQDRYSSVYVLGQWVESSYLLSKVALQTGDFAGVKESMGGAEQIVDQLRKSGHFSDQLEKHFARLQDTVSSGELDPTNLRKLSNTLLAIRSSEAQG